MLQPIAQFVLGVGNGEIGRRVAPRTALDGDDVESGVGKLVRENGAGPSQANDDRILARKLARHCLLSLQIVSYRAATAVMRREITVTNSDELLMPTTGKVTRWL